MKKSIVILLHAGFWGCYALLFVMMLTAALQASQVSPSIPYILKVITGFAIIPSLVSFYAFYFKVFPKYQKTQKIGPALGLGVLIATGASAIGAIILSGIFGSSFMFNDGFTSFFSELFIIILLSSITGIIGLVLKGFETWFQEITLKQELTAKNHEMEMALVKAQLDPHFLFNTLNNIDVMIQKTPEQASNYLNKLSDIMRFMLFETKTEKIELKKEIDYIKKFIDLQKIRSTNPEFVKFDVIGNPDGKTIAPMLFIPFIENAFKHVGDKKKKHAIEIELTITENKVKFECSNINKVGKSMDENNGLGNELIKKRLNLLYPNKHQLNIDNKSDYYRLTLSVNNEQ